MHTQRTSMDEVTVMTEPLKTVSCSLWPQKIINIVSFIL